MRSIPVVFVLTALTMLAVGCGGEKLVEMKNKEMVESTISGSDRPVVMLFAKDGCAPCYTTMGTLQKMAAEYHGRATFAEYPLMTFVFIPRSMDIINKYEVILYPTVVLFINGKEKDRWVGVFLPEQCRRQLNEVVGPPPSTQPVAAAPTTRPAETVAETPAATRGPNATTNPSPTTNPVAIEK